MSWVWKRALVSPLRRPAGFRAGHGAWKDPVTGGKRVPQVCLNRHQTFKGAEIECVLMVGDDRDRSRSKRRSRRGDTCRSCGKQLTPSLKDVEGANGPVRVSFRGLPCLRCPDSHETRGPYPDFRATLLDGVYDAVPKSKSRMHARRISFECRDCHAPLDVSSLVLAHFLFQLRLGSDTVDVTVSMPSARCPRCGKEQALAQRSRLLGVVTERLSDAVIDLLCKAGIVQRRPVPQFQASPYASAAAIALFSLMLFVAFLIVLSLAPDEVKFAPLFWIAVIAWALIAFPFFPPDEIPGVRPPGKAGLVGSTVFGAALLLFTAGVLVKNRFPIAQIGFGAAGALLALGAWFIYSYLWAARISTCTACGTWRWFLPHEGAWYCNNCGLPISVQSLSGAHSETQEQAHSRQVELRRFLVRFALGPLWLFVGLIEAGAAALLGYPPPLIGSILLLLLWGLVATIAVAIFAYSQHVHRSRLTNA